MTELSTTVQLHLGDVAVLGLLVVGLVLLGRLGWIVIDLAIDAMRRHNDAPELLDEYSDDVPNHGYAAFGTAVADAVELPGDREHSWPGMAPLLADFDDGPSWPTVGALAETESETSGRHAKVDGDDTATGLIPVVDDEAALAAVAAVSSQEGVS